MSIKSLIALILIPIFVGKLFIVDAVIINLFSEGKVTFVKPFCKKKGFNLEKDKPHEFVQDIDNQNTMLEISSFCTPQFNFIVFNWHPNLFEVFPRENSIFSSKLSYLYLDSHSPPPRLV